ncbi:orotate phosphoribosyltransferase [Bifidobacterium saguinibicoloris]|uniref:orotate phosphoribosyltransferase n=1 Tax=Bifidobacterium saguinibicoloris TaxID=2834433 RepID=UPI001C59790E|nr:orotate phosphoribosyltransferase [Bifidobacterium saguinibicoloris]MBW3081551.1 orotate phosphoribosyltransferase [Bifidobacterium saguinibicoloris]
MSESGFRPTGPAELRGNAHDGAQGKTPGTGARTLEDGSLDFASLEPREQLRTLLATTVVGRPFSELYGVTLDHRSASVMGHVLLDTLEDAGYSVDDFDAVGALTAASVPLVSAAIQAAASRGENLDGFVMDFVFPSVKGPSIKGKRVILLDAWLSEKSYVQTSSLVTLRNGNELSLDFSIVEHEGASVVAVASLVGGVGQGADEHEITVISPVDGARHEIPFIQVFHEDELKA